MLRGSRNEFLHHFYTPEEKFRREIQIRQFLEKVFNENMELSKHDNKAIEGIKRCAYEFLSNTHEHGRADVNNYRLIPKSIRGISFHTFSFSDKDKKLSLHKSPRFSSFLNNHKKFIQLRSLIMAKELLKTIMSLQHKRKKMTWDLAKEKSFLKKFSSMELQVLICQILA